MASAWTPSERLIYEAGKREIMSKNENPLSDPRADNGSFWFDSLDTPSTIAATDELPTNVDVAIIGAGYTGLWTAYYLKEKDPSLDIAVFEANTVGFGASGRNGGWCMGLAWGIEGMLMDDKWRDAGVRLLRAMHDTVDEVGRISQREGIECHFAKGGTLEVAIAPFHVKDMREHMAHLQGLGFTEEDYRWLPADEAQKRVGMTPNHGATYTPHCAVIHPARLVKGLGRVVRTKGVKIYEGTPVIEMASGYVDTHKGRVAASKIIRATEGYTESIKGQERQMLPLYSMMVATEPLPDHVWDEIGLASRETFGDSRRVTIYGQKTDDGRLAFGGRAGYYFGSKRRGVIPPDDPMVQNVEATLRKIFPVLQGYCVTYGWGGLMGVPRHWRPSVAFDRQTGLGHAGGYTGEGVAASNLAGRILSDLVLERESDLTDLAWVNDIPARWEPEPLRWLGVKAIQYFGDKADRIEMETGKPSRFWGTLFGTALS